MNYAKITQKKGHLIEMEFLQGYLAAHCIPNKEGGLKYDDKVLPIVTICMMTGRSILDETND